jgi:hypothetical protein
MLGPLCAHCMHYVQKRLQILMVTWASANSNVLFWSDFEIWSAGPQTPSEASLLPVWFVDIPQRFVGRDIAVGIATGYGLDGPRIETRWGARFSAPVQTQPPLEWIQGLFPGGKAAGAWRWPPTPSIIEVKERVELYLYSPPGPSWPVLEWSIPLLLPYHSDLLWQIRCVHHSC